VGMVREKRYLYVQRGETLVIMSGLSSEDLIRTAGSLRPVEGNNS
jgi:hypothetical protein